MKVMSGPSALEFLCSHYRQLAVVFLCMTYASALPIIALPRLSPGIFGCLLMLALAGLSLSRPLDRLRQQILTERRRALMEEIATRARGSSSVSHA
ncbi:MAG: hypothetical protein HC869_11175 [Rhodospirillales bacterium]|nr:hypothetical protein [Rhodospirillales bacterium]